MNEYVPDTTFTNFKDRPINIYRPVANSGKFIATMASYLNKQKQTKLAAVVESENEPFTPLKESHFITISDAEVALSKGKEIRFKKQLDDYEDYVKADKVMFAITISCCSPTVHTQLKMQPE